MPDACCAEKDTCDLSQAVPPDALRGMVQIQMHIVQKKIPTFSVKWCLLQLLNVICWLVTIVAAIGSIQGMIMDTQGFQAFKLST